MTGDIPGANGHIDQGSTQPNTVPGQRMGRRTALEVFVAGTAFIAGIFAEKKRSELPLNEIVLLLPEAIGTIENTYIAPDLAPGHDLLVVEGKIFYNSGWELLHLNLTAPDPDNTLLPGIEHDPNDTEDTGNKIIGRISPQGNYYSLGVDLVRAGAKLGSKIPVSLDLYFIKQGTTEVDNSRITSNTLGVASVTVSYIK